MVANYLGDEDQSLKTKKKGKFRDDDADYRLERPEAIMMAAREIPRELRWRKPYTLVKKAGVGAEQLNPHSRFVCGGTWCDKVLLRAKWPLHVNYALPEPVQVTRASKANPALLARESAGTCFPPQSCVAREVAPGNGEERGDAAGLRRVDDAMFCAHCK